MSIETTQKNESFHEAIMGAVKKQFEKEVEILFEEAKKKIIEDLERKKGEIISGIVLNITERMTINSIGPELHIVVSKSKDL